MTPFNKFYVFENGASTHFMHLSPPLTYLSRTLLGSDRKYFAYRSAPRRA